MRRRMRKITTTTTPVESSSSTRWTSAARRPQRHLAVHRAQFPQAAAVARVYVTTRPEAPITEALRKLRPQELVPESEENQRDLLIYFRRLLEAHGELVDDVTAAAEMLLGKARGLFVYAAMATEHVDRLHRGGQLSLASIRAMPELDEFYDQQMERLLGQGTDALEWRAVRLLPLPRAAPRGDASDILGVFGQGAAARGAVVPPDPRSQAPRVPQSVRDWLPEERRRDVGAVCGRKRGGSRRGGAVPRGARRCADPEGSGGGTSTTTAQRGDVRGRHGAAPAAWRPAAMTRAGGWIRSGCSRGAAPKMRWESARTARRCAVRNRRNVPSSSSSSSSSVSFGVRTPWTWWVVPSTSRCRTCGRTGVAPGQLVGRLMEGAGAGASAPGDFGACAGLCLQCPASRTLEQRGACLRKLLGHTHSHIGMLLLPTARVVSGSYDKTVRIWDAAWASAWSVLWTAHFSCDIGGVLGQRVVSDK